jgi:putative Holliday junction resolvase
MAAAYILQGALDRLGRLGPQEDGEDESQYD